MSVVVFFHALFASRCAYADPVVIIDANGNVFEYFDSTEDKKLQLSQDLSENSDCISTVDPLPSHSNVQINNKCNTSSQQKPPQHPISSFQPTVGIQPTKTSLKKTNQSVPTVNLDFQNADIHSIIRLFGEVSGRNFIIDDSVQGKVSVTFQDVPWDHALAAILMSKGLGWTSMGNPHATSLQQGSVFVISPIGQ